MATSNPTLCTDAIRAQLEQAVAHLLHLLPVQAPLSDFVHHNTLHSFEHLPFKTAVTEAGNILGAHGFFTHEQFRELYRQGRIAREDLEPVLADARELDAAEVLLERTPEPLRRSDVYLTAMLYPFPALTATQLNWQIEELAALEAFQADVPDAQRQTLLQASGGSEAATLRQLWEACLARLNLQHYLLHPEELTDLAPEQAEQMLAPLRTVEQSGAAAQLAEQPMVQQLVRRDAARTLDDLLNGQRTLRSILLSLSGEDILEQIRPLLIRFTANYLDQGLAAWHSPEREQGFYQAWRHSAAADLAWLLEDLPEWRHEVEMLSDDPIATIIIQLRRLGLAETHWAHYLEQLALELPGWSGMLAWRQQHPGYADQPQPVSLYDYLAVRLVLERIFAQRICRKLWQVELSLDMLRWYFRHHRAEFYVRHALFNTRIPEYLTSQAQHLVAQSGLGMNTNTQWQHMANMIWTWRQSPAADRPAGYTVYRSAWQLFRLAQHLALDHQQVRQLSDSQLHSLFGCLALPAEEYSYLWLQAYERHYRDQLLLALQDNHGRGRWRQRPRRPTAQLVFCMDEREEGFRRHLEAHQPEIETLGAAGFFGVAINWRGLDDTRVTALCPIVVTPSHEVQEIPREDQGPRLQQHVRRRHWYLRLLGLLHNELRRNLLSAWLLMLISAPFTLLALLGKSLLPRRFGIWQQALRQGFTLPVASRVRITAEADTPASPQHPRPGFTDSEQAERVENFLRTIGLSHGFAPLVVMMGHGSSSLNNPHLAAYDCGACSGRHGGPNARVFAAMANRPQIRGLLQQRGLTIPDDTWFLAAEHNTCSESIDWYDLDVMPAQHQPGLQALQLQLEQARLGSATERCRRFASAPPAPTARQALAHVSGRALDFSQARPELGHATNAAAFIGRRAMSQGAFLDRRVFLISYDPTQDPDGRIIENILLNAGPVGAGINLEYYFSTVNNEQYGCGSKITHNVAGLFGVMDGTSSDLRTGLPRQMVEIHEPMRLQIVVEASTSILSQIVARQPALQQLVGNGWVLLSAKDPDSARIQIYVPDQGFQDWQAPAQAAPRVKNSAQWYRGHDGPVQPALLEQEPLA